MRKNSGGPWCQCALPECNIGASVQAAAWETGESRSHRSVIMSFSLSPPPPAPPNLPISVSAAFFLVSLSHVFILLFSSWSQGPVPDFPVLIFFYLDHPGPTSYPVMTVQFLCATEKSLVMITLRLFCLLYLLKICYICGKTLITLMIQG